MKKTHSKYGGSEAHRYWECAGCINLIAIAKSRKDYDPSSSKYAIEGKAAHLLGEQCLLMDEDSEEFIGEVYEIEDKYITISRNMAEAVQIYLNSVRHAISGFGTNKNFLEIEKEFALPDVDPTAFGTNDACLYVPFHKLFVWDYKHGKGIVVEVKFNKQLLFYALGALKGKEDVKEVELILVQPRIPHKNGKVRSVTYSVDKLKLFEIELKEKIKATKNPKAIRKGGDWCKFCDAYKICPEAKKNIWRGRRVRNSVADAIEDFK